MKYHPHYIEHIESLDAPHISSAQYDSDEARMGASWHDTEWHHDRAWLLTSRDVWVSNPLYVGPPNPPHPESQCYESDEEYDAWNSFRKAWWAAHKAKAPYPLETVYAESPVIADEIDDDDIPF
jgi:hypothetical protein